MPFQKGREKTGGRRPNTANKITLSVKDALNHAFDDLGGVNSFSVWAKENETEFYKLFARMLPKDVNLTGGVDLVLSEALRDLPEK